MPSHLQDFLNYYKMRDAPGYAVLVTGDWGVGKTYQVKKALPESERYYVSLFGLQTPEDVVASVYAKMFPVKAKVKSASEGFAGAEAQTPYINLGLAGMVKGLVNAVLRNEVRNDRTIIFDDLERCGLNLKDALGVINMYVEHHGCRVVVIAHDDKLAAEFKEAKEKLFGQTVDVEPATEDAFKSFLEALPWSNGRAFVTRHRQDIVKAFETSKVRSLRILKHLIDDLVRLAETLKQEHHEHVQAMSALVREFSDADIRWRAGTITEAELRERTDPGSAAATDAKTIGKKELVFFRVGGSLMTILPPVSPILDNATLAELLIHGRYDQSRVQLCLNNSKYFIRAEASPAWRLLMNFQRLDSDTVDNAQMTLEKQFRGREFSDSGEVLHVFAMRFMMAAFGITAKSVDEVKEECIAYIDDLVAQKRLPARGLNHDWTLEFCASSFGVQYYVAEPYKEAFTEVFKYLVAARQKVLEDDFPRHAEHLLALMKTDMRQFREELRTTYADIPILAHVSPIEFAEAWMLSPRSDWGSISRDLTDRVRSDRKVVLSEAGWLSKVNQLLVEQANKARGFDKIRILSILPERPQKS